jgi:uncharacterized alkaline shock family protein YloU
MTDIGAAAADPRGVAAADETTIIRPRGFGGLGPAAAPTSGGRVYSTGVEPPDAREEAAPAGPGGAARGRTTIADEVVEQVIRRIVDLAVEETAGLHGLHTGSAAGDDGPVSVRLDGDRAEIDVAVDVEFGHPVHEVVEALRTGLIGSAERLLGLNVAQVDVFVAGVAFGQPGQAPDPPSR